MLDKDDAKHLEEYLRERNQLKNRLQSMDHLIAGLEFKMDKVMNDAPETKTVYSPHVLKHKPTTDAEVMNDD